MCGFGVGLCGCRVRWFGSWWVGLVECIGDLSAVSSSLIWSYYTVAN